MRKYHYAERRQWKSEEFDGLKPTVYDWCRMAAFLDGEGCLNINTCSPSKLRYIVKITLVNTNYALSAWALETFGGNVTYRDHNNPKWKVVSVWSCTAARAAWIMHNCLPWFILKRAQAVLLMELQENIDGTRQGRGRRVEPGALEKRAVIRKHISVLNARGPKH